MARKRSRIQWCLHGVLCAGFLTLALIGWAAPGGAADEHASTPAASSGAVDEQASTAVAPNEAADEHAATPAAPDEAADVYDCSTKEPCPFWGPHGTAPKKCCVWDDYDSKEAGNPVRIAAYVLHPVGVVIDWLIFRPAWWIGSHEPFYTLFGRTD